MIRIATQTTDWAWARCPDNRNNTSGGCVLLGGHALKQWFSTHAFVAVSYGEFEFASVIRGAGQSLVYKAWLGDLGVDARLGVGTGSSAVMGNWLQTRIGRTAAPRHAYTLDPASLPRGTGGPRESARRGGTGRSPNEAQPQQTTLIKICRAARVQVCRLASQWRRMGEG